MSRIPCALCASALILLAFGVRLEAAGQREGAMGSRNVGPANIRQQRPGFLVRADVDHVTRRYTEGDSLAISAIPEVDAYLYVVYQQVDGKTYQIFPNSAQRENRVRAKQEVSIPAPDDLFRWSVGPPFGKEMIKVIASKEPIRPLADPALRRGRFNPVSPAKLLDTKADLEAGKSAEWAEHQIEITTAARTEATANAPRRVGVFFGIGHYEFNDEAKEGTQGKWEPDRIATNAVTMSKVMREVGGLQEFRVYTDRESTRAQMEQSITGWLPSVSRPGDTVFIYIWTHGDRFIDPERRENSPHRFTHYLLPYEFSDPVILRVLLKQRQEGKLDPARAARVDAWDSLVRQQPTERDTWIAMIKATCITDPVFGHWLQYLDGRQVVVILEACHSSGFAEEGKGLGEPDEDFRFEFLEGNLSRLKDIGQEGTVLLTSCSADQESYTHRASNEVLAQWRSQVKDLDADQLRTPLSVMTYHLIDAILLRPAPLTVEDGWRSCAAGMHDYFVTFNAIAAKKGLKPLIEHQPRLLNYSSRPVLLKP